MRKIFNKKVLIAISVIIVVIGLLTSIYYIDLSRFNKNHKKYDNKYLLNVTYLIGDSKKLDKDITIDETVDYNNSSILFSVNQVIPLNKENNYLTADLDDFTNDKLLKVVTDYIFTMNNNNGEIVDDCSYDKTNNTIKIPISFYENKIADQSIPLRLEVESLMAEKDIKALDVDTSLKGLITKNITIKSNNHELTTAFKINNLFNINKNQIKIYVNNSNTPIESNAYNFDKKTNIVTLYIPGILVDKIDVKMSNILLDVVSAGYEEQVDSPSKFNGIKVNDPINITGSTTLSIGGISYCTSTGDGCISIDGQIMYSQGSKGASYYYTYDSNYRRYSTQRYDHLFPYAVDVDYLLSALGTSMASDFSLTGGNGSRIAFYCAQHGAPVDSTPSRMNFTVTRIAGGDDWIALKFKSQAGTGGQYAESYMKFEWENAKCRVRPRKLFATGTIIPQNAKATFELHKGDGVENGSCTGTLLDTKTVEIKDDNIFNNGEYYSLPNDTFDADLTVGSKYCMEETSFVDSNGNNLLAHDYKAVSKTSVFTAVDNDNGANGEGMCDDWPGVTNKERRYCTAIKKVDSETNIALRGVNFSLNGEGNYATNNDGIYIWTNLKYGTYKAKELTPTGTVLTGTDDKSYKYFNDNNGSDIALTLTEQDDSGNCPSNVSTVTHKDTKIYYCLRAKKVDSATLKGVAGAKFTAKKGSTTAEASNNGVGDANGVVAFFIGDSSKAGTYTITETEAPFGYVLPDPNYKSAEAIAMTKYNTEAAAKSACFNTIDSNGRYVELTGVDPASFVFEDSKLLLNWYKTTEDERTTAAGATFKTSYKDSNNTTQYVKVKSNKIDQTDENNITKSCYQFDSYTTSSSEASTLTSDNNGEVCIAGVQKEATYTVEEIKPVKYHTFGTKKTITITTSTTYQPMTKTTNQFINYPTEFKFTKKVTNTDGTQEGTFAAKTTEELKKLVFNVYDSEGNPVSFILKNGVYEYAGNNVDPASGDASTTLNLNNSRQINIKHLPTGTYTIKEVDTSSCGLNNGKQNTITQSTTRPGSAGSCSNPGSGNNGDCIGYYMPDYTSTTNNRFTITDCSSSNATSCSSYGVVETNTDNTPTEITLTKKDFYSYNDASDVQDEDREKDSKESEAAFENAKERSDFDRIDFKIKDSNGNYLNFYYVGGTSTTCSSDSDYSIYRYVPGLTLGEGTDPNVFTGVIGSVTQTLHACGGHIKIIGLCRGKTYTFEEVKVPDDSVYVRENTDGTPTSVCFEIPCVGDEVTTQTSKTVIVDKPTRQRLEKRDSKYNYLIPDESVTFEVYRCPKDNPDCHPSDYGTIDEETKEFKINKETAKAAGIELVKFSPRSILNGDEEDPNFDDTSSNQDKDNVNKANEDALNGVEVYRYMSDSDAKNKAECRNDLGGSNCYVTRLHPDKGILVFRYLQSGYTYKIVEIAAPKNYLLPTGYDKENTFKVISTTVNTEKLNIANQPTAILVRKFDGNGNLLPGAKFRVYQVTNYDPSRKPQDQEKRVVSLKTIRDGVYEARPKEDTEVIVTCDNKNGNCADTTKLTFDLYNDTWANFDNLETNNGTNAKVALQEGTALIQYLEYNYHYVIEEIEAPKGYSLPEDEDDRFTEIYIDKNETRIQETDSDALVNYPTPFTFYKFDEYNTPLDGGKFILQKLNSDKKYETMRLSKVEGEVDKNGNPIALYKASIDGEIEEIDTTNGKATVYYLEAGQYRILEVKAPEGYELPKKTINVCTFFVDEDGVVRGNSIITNKPETKTKEVKNEAFAELIITPATGQKVIKYGAIIAGLILIIAGLMIFMKKRK